MLFSLEWLLELCPTDAEASRVADVLTARGQLAREPAELYGFTDRGTLEVGKRADANVIDLGALRLHAPINVSDLPTGATRLVQHVDGYRATIAAGRVTFRDGRETGARPASLLRRG